MVKIGRNEKCPCGSGLKYKKCCINIDKESQNYKPLNFEEFRQQSYQNITDRDYKLINQFILKNNSKELLKTLAYLQLQPQNHSKNVRFEILIHQVLSSPNFNSPKNKGSLNQNEFKSLLDKELPYHEFEDPAEGFFTENLIFTNGNNVVYSGIATDTCGVVQGLINVILSGIKFTDKFKKEVLSGCLFILEIHKEIANKLGHIHRMYEEIENDEIYFPGSEMFKKNKELFCYNQDDIDSLCKKLNIAPDVINYFLCVEPVKEHSSYEKDESPLLIKPFIKLEGEYYLVLPTTELFCLNEFIIEKAQEYKCLDLLVEAYAKQQSNIAFTWFRKMNWKQEAFKFSEQNENKIAYIVNKTLFKFDEDKFSVVLHINESTITKNESYEIDEISALSNQIIAEVKEKYPNHKILLVSIYQKYRMLKNTMFGLTHDIKADFSIGMLMASFEAIINSWNFDKLNFWKYARQLEEVSYSGLFSHFNTHLSKMNWYKRNHDSFYDSDEAMPNMMLFDLSTEGKIKRKGLKKIDKIGIPIFMDGEYGYLQCIRQDENIPIYISSEFMYGFIRSCLYSYSFPIWMNAKRRLDKKANTYISAILYWLHDMKPSLQDYLSPLKELPIHFVLELDQEIYDLQTLENLENESLNFSYSIDLTNGIIDFKVPLGLIDFLSSSSNRGEQILMAFIIDSLGFFMEKSGVGKRMNIEQRDEIIFKHIPTGNKKMILMPTGGSQYGMLLSDIDIDDYRYLQDSEKSFILENQVKWYKKSIEEDFIEKNKNSFLNDFSFINMKKAIELIQEFNIKNLLPYVIKRHESLIQNKYFRQVYYPARMLCYEKYLDVKQEFFESEKRQIETSLVYRVLIEFIVAENPKGNRLPNDDDLDLILSHLSQVNNYAYLSDEIIYGFKDPKIWILPSGRIGIDKKISDEFNKSLSHAIYGEDFDTYKESFQNNFYSKDNELEVEKDYAHIEKVSKGFLKDWNISLFDIYNIGHFLCEFSLSKNKSYCEITEDQFYEELKIEFTEKVITAFIKVMCISTRNGILNFPNGIRKEEFYPWRYNRLYSYIRKPLIKLIREDEVFYCWGARHMLNSVSNLLHSFYDGTLRTENALNINNLIAERLVVKGSEFNDKVYNWLKENSKLEIIGKDKWIKPKGFFHSEINVGDIDVLGIDHSKKIIYSIECKNTSQAKLPYEYHSEMMKYFGKEGSKKEGLITKHVNRDNWLKENKDKVVLKLGVTRAYVIKSIIVTSNFLPSKLIKRPVLETYSLWEVKKNKLL
ncbi:YecA family protein [Aquimarina litoralis]|uniref:YecA family protein n=1 Tax=Aquimarina litoralis TaxID=584605 RepID=UPI001C5765A0|nr:SEC-C domain-containing protein [Aquimarina litoralis]MBW1297780.1 hypothetical protein [Aquimarina litoralis]